MARLFISAERLEAWTAEGRAALEGDKMTLVELGRVFHIRSAVRFTGVTGEELDELVEMGADHMANSVIYGETAYEVQNGFVGQPLPP